MRVIDVPFVTTFTLLSLLYSSPVIATVGHQGHDAARRHHSPPGARGTGGYVSTGYFTNTDIYAKNFQPTDIVSKTLTHILYAFADTDPTNGNAKLTDLWSDQQKHYPGDSWSEPGNNLYGNFKQLYLLKQARRNLKVLLSIGGYGNTQAGHFNFISKPSARANFVTTAIQLVEDNGLDGIDIDFEYPTASQKADFVKLVRELRLGLDQYAIKKHDVVPYQLSLAVPAGPLDCVNFDVAAMDPFVTNWNVMTYDYAGPWSKVSDYMDNLYRGKTQQGIDTDSVLKWYIGHGASPGKITMGIPLYGRSFENTNGIQQPYNGVGAGGGIWDVKVLPRPGAKVTEDFNTGASYSYDAAKKELITFDTVNIAKAKAQYVVNHGFAGSMYWDLSSDHVGSGSLVSATISQYQKLDNTLNHLQYPGSRFDNIKSCMGACPTSPCKNLKSWNQATHYPKGAAIKDHGFEWTANRATHNEAPGGKNNAWKKLKAC